MIGLFVNNKVLFSGLAFLILLCGFLILHEVQGGIGRQQSEVGCRMSEVGKGLKPMEYRNKEEILAQQLNPERYNDEVIFPDKVKINREYIQNYHFAKDIKYIIQTVLGWDS